MQTIDQNRHGGSRLTMELIKLKGGVTPDDWGLELIKLKRGVTPDD